MDQTQGSGAFFMKKQNTGDGPVIIKKYANRRLYNTETSSYITLEHLAAMTREGRDFKVVDAKSEEDITHNILTQIIMEEESRGQTMLPVNFLRQLIGLYGNQMQGMVPQYLEAAMDAFQNNQSALRDAFGANAFAEIAKRNMAMFEDASRAFTGKAKTDEPKAAPGGDVDQLRAELAALQAKIDRLGK
jgi:polyhydroxyalkanoate synthesis repressor PhaR